VPDNGWPRGVCGRCHNDHKRARGAVQNATVHTVTLWAPYPDTARSRRTGHRGRRSWGAGPVTGVLATSAENAINSR